MEERLTNELAEKKSIIEKLKSYDIMLWIRKMNNIRKQSHRKCVRRSGIFKIY